MAAEQDLCADCGHARAAHRGGDQHTCLQPPADDAPRGGEPRNPDYPDCCGCTPFVEPA